MSSGVINVEADPCNPNVKLPTTYITMKAVDGTNSYFNMTLSNISAGYDVTNGIYLGWCIQQDIKMSRGVNHTVVLYSSYDLNVPESYQDDDLDKVNYILNHKQEYSSSSIQNAIWYYICDIYPSDSDAQAIINETNISGSNFCPSPSDIIAILVEGIGGIQRTLFELTLPEKEDEPIPSNGGGSVSNHPPTADAYFAEPYLGFVDSEIIFDGSPSYDRDGFIISWYWDFGNGKNGSGEIVTHIYSNPGTYKVILTVTDDDGATDSYHTKANIALPNRPPDTPTINGTKIGTKNTTYTYTAVSTDLDNDTIRYVFDWDDTASNTTDFMVNGTKVNETHSWTAAGIYLVKIYAEDENNATSNTAEMLILIDVNVEFINGEINGYLIDYEQDGTFNKFYNNATGIETEVEKQDNETYLIDSDGDGNWDFIFNQVTGLEAYQQGKQKETPVDETNSMFYLQITVIIIVVCTVVLSLFWKWKKQA